MKTKFFRCTHCGNVVMMAVDSGVTPVCCGEEMQELVPATVDASKEKHVPVVKTCCGGKVTVNVGSLEHPMTDGHYIEFVGIETENGVQIRNLKPGDKPEVHFELVAGDKVKNAFCFCNLHMFWMS